MDEADHRQRRLLRLRRAWPRHRRSAKSCGKLTENRTPSPMAGLFAEMRPPDCEAAGQGSIKHVRKRHHVAFGSDSVAALRDRHGRLGRIDNAETWVGAASISSPESCDRLSERRAAIPFGFVAPSLSAVGRDFHLGRSRAEHGACLSRCAVPTRGARCRPSLRRPVVPGCPRHCAHRLTRRRPRNH
jgi:hypothetical protein